MIQVSLGNPGPEPTAADIEIPVAEILVPGGLENIPSDLPKPAPGEPGALEGQAPPSPLICTGTSGEEGLTDQTALTLVIPLLSSAPAARAVQLSELDCVTLTLNPKSEPLFTKPPESDTPPIQIAPSAESKPQEDSSGARSEPAEKTAVLLDRGAIDIALSVSAPPLAGGEIHSLVLAPPAPAPPQLGQEQLRVYNQSLISLSKRVLEAQEGERSRIARELHDQIGQDLTCLKITLQALVGAIERAEVRAQIEECISTTHRLLEEVRALSFSLRPDLLDNLGLVPALRSYLFRIAGKAKLVAQFASNLSERRLPEEYEITIYRVAQEALTNVVRHAKAHTVWVRLYDDTGLIVLEVRDDGAGFDLSAGGFWSDPQARLGLLGMQERCEFIGGRLEIVSAPGSGTRVLASFPLPGAGP